MFGEPEILHFRGSVDLLFVHFLIRGNDQGTVLFDGSIILYLFIWSYLLKAIVNDGNLHTAIENPCFIAGNYKCVNKQIIVSLVHIDTIVDYAIETIWIWNVKKEFEKNATCKEIFLRKFTSNFRQTTMWATFNFNNDGLGKLVFIFELPSINCTVKLRSPL
jgi:hypothetical protein